MSLSQSLVAQLRRRIMDDRVGRTSFRLACIDEAATDCLVSISAAKVLTTNVMNGRTAASLSLDLTSTLYGGVKDLVEHLQTLPGYQVTVEADFEPTHPASDLEVVGSMSLLNNAAAFKHHLFSDHELLEILDLACRRHNLSYTPESVPTAEYVFVLMLSHAEVCRRLAGDAAKRRNIATTVDQLLAVARDLEAVYSADIRRQQRAIPVAKLDESAVQQGDVVVGTFSRRSLRTGYFAPVGNAGLLSAAVLEEPAPADVEDVKVTLRWRRNTDMRFYAYELWRDTVASVARPVAIDSSAGSLLREQVKKPYTSKLVFRTYGANTNREGGPWSSYVDQSGQLVTEYTDATSPSGGSNADGGMDVPPLEPETEYYYRLYIISLNHEIVGSNVVCVKTKAMRALLATTAPLTPTSGVAGATCTLVGTGFVSGMSVTVGGKSVVLTIASPTVATFPVPTFSHPEAVGSFYDVVLTSPNGLRDVLAQGFEYKGP